MTSVFKYPLHVTDIQDVSMPADSTILTVQVQRDTPCIWALVDTDRPFVKRSIRIVGTGHPFDPLERRYVYIGTFQMHGGALIFHVFEQVNA